MNDPIISPEHIRYTVRARARRAFEAGQSRDSHNMNPGAAALETWQAEFDRLVEQARHDNVRWPRAIA